ncbi:hypothetical protein PPMP20_10880 [Paraburkholderia phymatum]|nr:hypothetical protein [Paraburkholderia phymatum]
MEARFGRARRCAPCSRYGLHLQTTRDGSRANALAAPLSRGDVGVVETQLSLLEGLGVDCSTLFGLIARRAVALARRRTTPPVAADAVATGVE